MEKLQETGATKQIMKSVHEYGIACVNLHIRHREGLGSVDDERKHQQALWCAIEDMVNNEIEMLQLSSENLMNHMLYWKEIALKNSSSPMINEITGKPL